MRGVEPSDRRADARYNRTGGTSTMDAQARAQRPLAGGTPRSGEMRPANHRVTPEAPPLACVFGRLGAGEL